MAISDYMNGESKSLEFKVALPSKAENYVKTVVAFANGNGGKIVVGIDDKTKKIVGVDDEKVFQIMDAVANTVSDMVEPQIVPNIMLETVNGKSLVVIEIEAGENRPYYIKAEGRDRGTYIRVGATSRPADSMQIKELEIEGKNLSWDKLRCVGCSVDDATVEKLCADINRYREKLAHGNEGKVGIKQLMSWDVLLADEKSPVATNAFALLTGEKFDYAKVQCARFKGKDRSVFIDRKEYTGPLYEQVENAYRFVLNYIEMNTEIKGLVREDKYEVPVSAVREMIINAVCHRNYMNDSAIQVSVFDDRIEVTSPGTICRGLTLKDALEGYSKTRNKVIAKVFHHMGLIEEWGTGLGRILRQAESYHLKVPEFTEMDTAFRVNLYRTPASKSSEKGSVKSSEKGSVKSSEKIIDAIRQNPSVTIEELAKITQTTTRSVEKNLKKLKDQNRIARIGAANGGKWAVKDE